MSDRYYRSSLGLRPPAVPILWVVAYEGVRRDAEHPKGAHSSKDGQTVGIRELEEKIWLVSFMHYDLGFFDHETGPSPKCPERTF
jgi:hypothetical protein